MSMTCLKQLIDICYDILMLHVLFLNLQMWKKLKASLEDLVFAIESWIMNKVYILEEITQSV